MWVFSTGPEGPPCSLLRMGNAHVVSTATKDRSIVEARTGIGRAIAGTVDLGRTPARRAIRLRVYTDINVPGLAV